MAFNLPVPEGDNGATFLKDGLKVTESGEIIPYEAIKKFTASDDELEVELRDPERETLVFIIEEGCSHQLLDIETFVDTHMMQTGKAEFDTTREKIINKPEFNMRKIRKSFTKAYSFGR